MPRLHLITLGPSHFCEKARWALQRTAIDFKETRHIPGFHLFSVKKLGGERTSLPKLVIWNGEETTVLHESSDIMAFSDTFIESEGEHLYPASQQESVRSWEAEFDEVLGPHIRRWAYCHVLYYKGIFGILSQGASFLEKVAGFFLLPLVQRLVYKAIGCHKPNAKDISLGKIVAIFKKVDLALEDGRPFICGDTFTAADLTFAALAGPAISPPGYGNYMLPLEDCPSEMAENMRMLRETVAGKHVLRLYETQRYKIAH